MNLRSLQKLRKVHNSEPVIINGMTNKWLNSSKQMKHMKNKSILLGSTNCMSRILSAQTAETYLPNLVASAMD